MPSKTGELRSLTEQIKDAESLLVQVLQCQGHFCHVECSHVLVKVAHLAQEGLEVASDQVLHDLEGRELV